MNKAIYFLKFHILFLSSVVLQDNTKFKLFVIIDLFELTLVSALSPEREHSSCKYSGTSLERWCLLVQK